MLRDTFHTLTSRTARRTYVYAVLLTLTSALLYGVAVLGYLGFYRDYVPHRVRSAPLHLQYGPFRGPLGDAILHRQHPFAVADLRSLELTTAQDYDVSVALTLPRSPGNTALGNIMVELVLATAGKSESASAASGASPSDAIAAAARLPPLAPRSFLESGGRRILYAAARPALLAYTDPLVATAGRLLLLPYHLLAPAGAAESTRLVVSMAESLSFGRAAPPAVLFLEVRAAQELQTYAAEIVFAARLRGLRWFMFHHKITAFLVLTTAFWLAEALAMVVVFAGVGLLSSGPAGGGAGTDAASTGGSTRPPVPPLKNRRRAIKAEEDEPPILLSLLSAPPARPAVKKEGGGGGSHVLAAVPAAPSAAAGGLAIDSGASDGGRIATSKNDASSEYTEGASEDDGDDKFDASDHEELLVAPVWKPKDASATTGSASMELSGPLRRRLSWSP